MPVTRHPPHRSQRALLTRWAPASGNDAQAFRRIRMQDSGIWEPSAYQSVHPRPRDSVPIAASAQRPTPQAENSLPEDREHRAVMTEVCFAATPLDLLSSCHARLLYLLRFAIKNTDIAPILAALWARLQAITSTSLGPTPSHSCHPRLRSPSFCHQKHRYCPDFGRFFGTITSNHKYFAWPDPLPPNIRCQRTGLLPRE